MKKIFKFALKNYFITIFIAIILFVGAVSFYKLFYSKATFVYAKVKLGQGPWWSGGTKPASWFVKAIKKGDRELDLVGRPIAEVLSVRYYPWWASDQFDVYLTLKLRVSENKRAKKYNFKRSTLGVASPIELELSGAQVSGTVVDLSSIPFEDKYLEKQVILTKKWAYPWEFEALKIGDSYFDGEATVFEILDKQASNISVISSDAFGESNPKITEPKLYILVKAKIKLKEVGGQLIFGEDQKINTGKIINLSTPNFTFQDYIVGKIE